MRRDDRPSHPGGTAVVPVLPDEVSPAGVAEIRHLRSLPTGELTHVVVPAGKVSRPAALETVAEFFVVLSGRGELWRAGHPREVTPLVPGLCAYIPAGVDFQYRAGQEDLVILLAAVPRWRPEAHHLRSGGPWTPTEAGPPDAIASGAAGVVQHPDLDAHLRWHPDYAAPDTSEIRLLSEEDRGGVAHCRLPAAAVTMPVQHPEVAEIWYVVAGDGELWCCDATVPDDPGSVAPLQPGTCVDIPPATGFQFRSGATTALEMVLLTMPRWPGPEAARPLDWGHWMWLPPAGSRPARDTRRGADAAAPTGSGPRTTQGRPVEEDG